MKKVDSRLKKVVGMVMTEEPDSFRLIQRRPGIGLQLLEFHRPSQVRANDPVGSDDRNCNDEISLRSVLVLQPRRLPGKEDRCSPIWDRLSSALGAARFGSVAIGPAHSVRAGPLAREGERSRQAWYRASVTRTTASVRVHKWCGSVVIQFAILMALSSSLL